MSRVAAGVWVAVVLVGCGGADGPDDDPTPATSALDGGVHLPAAAGPYAPSRALVVDRSGAPVTPSADDVARLARTDDCASCHEDVAHGWERSAHARSSFDNPWYRTSVDRFRQARGAESARFCAGCHDPVLLFAGAFSEDAPEITAEDPRAAAGIPCRLCHGAVEAAPDGDGSYVWSREPIPLPDPANEREIAEHRVRVRTDVLESAALCGACHRSFAGPATGNPHHLAGIDDIGAFAASPFGGTDAEHVEPDPVSPSTCRGCHMMPTRARRDMAASDGVVASHRFVGAHLGLSTDAEQRRQTIAQLERSASVDIVAVRAEASTRVPADGARVRPREPMVFEVVVRNEGVGHRFPGGTRDLQNTRLLLRITDARGRRIADTGEQAFVLSARVLEEDGTIQRLHDVDRFALAGLDRTIASRDAQLARFAWTPPRLSGRAYPLRVEARLVHRRHTAEFAALACEAQRTPRGRAFAALGRGYMDPCADPPATVIATDEVQIGRGARQPPPAEGHTRRLYAYALALAHGLQEHLGQAHTALDLLFAALPDSDTRGRAAAHTLRARVLGRQGRVDEALAEAARAEVLLPGHPAIARAEGRALQQVWRFTGEPNAAQAYERVVEGAPLDTRARRDWSGALGSAQRDREAWTVAAGGLARAPRDAALLRTQWLSLRALEHESAEAAADAADAHREPDDRARLLRACERVEPLCLRDRQPIPTIDVTNVER